MIAIKVLVSGADTPLQAAGKVASSVESKACFEGLWLLQLFKV